MCHFRVSWRSVASTDFASQRESRKTQAAAQRFFEHLATKRARTFAQPTTLKSTSRRIKSLRLRADGERI